MCMYACLDAGGGKIDPLELEAGCQQSDMGARN